MKILVATLLALSLLSCKKSVELEKLVSSLDSSPVAVNFSPPDFLENTESIITLTYNDEDGDLATSCSVTQLTNVSVTTPCTCLASGICSVGITGSLNYAGLASFDFSVMTEGQSSNLATATFSIISASDTAPVTAAISPASFNEDTESTITLSYTDADGDAATTCAVSNLSNISQSTGCACAAGVCTVGVTGSANYNGAASFDYTVTANAQTSNTSTASLVIDPVADAPVADDITPPNMTEDAESTITLSYSDADGDAAVSCVLSNLINVSETSGCTCAAGVCTVGVTGAANYVGAASFDYTVTANGLTSAAATASLTIDNVDDAPVAAAISPASFDEDIESIITLSYTDADSDQATACTIANETNVSVTTGCSCAAGTCTVGVTGSADYNGAASFDYTVTANSVVSNQVSASLTIDPVNDAPIASHNCSIFSVKDVAYSCTVSATDVDGGDTQSYSFVSNTCSFLSINASTGVISGTPTSVGSCAFSVKSNDGTVDSNVESIPFHGTYLPPMVATYRVGNGSYGDGDLSLTLPLRAGFTYNMKVDWGDGAISDVSASGDATRTHTYSGAGDYTVSLYGVAEAFYFNSGGDAGKMLAVSDLGEMGWTNLAYAFAGCSNMTTFAGGITDSVTDMDSMFLNASSLTSLDLATFNTASVTDMKSMFESVSALASLDLTVAGFDTTNVTSMEYMFKDMNALTSIDLSNFTTNNVTNMRGMFQGASTLTTLDASPLETQNVTNMSSMFQGLSALTSINLTGFNTSLVTEMASMFQSSSSLTSLDLSLFNTANVTTMNSMFEDMTGLTSLTLTGLNTSSVTNFADMFRGVAGISTLDVSSFDTSSATTMNRMFRDVSSVSSLNISNFVTSAVTDMEGMFWGMSGLTSLTWDTTKFNTSLVQNMQYMFRDLSSMTSLNLATSGSFFDTSNVTNMGSMFLGCSGLTTLNTTGWVTSSVTNMINMFNGLSSMTSFSIAHLDTSAVIDISRIFSGMSSVTTLDLSSNDTSSATNMQSMFSGMTSLTSINTGGSFSTASVTDMYEMFKNVNSMVTLNINHWDTSNVTRIRGMFSNMSSLTTLDIDLLNTSSVTDMIQVFYNASSLTSLDLSSWNVSNVTTMNGLFYGATSLSSINLTGWNTSNVTDMSEMFRGTSSLPALDTSSFNTSNVTDMSDMFLDASSLSSLNLAHFNTASVTNMESMFSNTSSLTSLTSTDWDVSAVTNSTNIFSGANAGLTVYCNYGNLFGETCN